jgi:haloalkane dehalogenase
VEIELRRTGELAYREVVPDAEEGAAPVLLLHGFPESSLMWEPVMRELAASGRRCVAPDLYGLGDSADAGPATFEHNLEALAEFHDELGLGRLAVIVHDWGGFVGLAWACMHPAEVEALVISNTGFFSDGRWHAMAAAIRDEGGEDIVGAIDREALVTTLAAAGDFDRAALDAYSRPFEDGRGQRAALDFYRSMDFSKLAPYDGKLAALDAPTLILWGETDRFAPLAGARRFEREIPRARLVVIEGAGHFVYDEQPERCAREVRDFLAGLDGYSRGA